MSVHLFAVSGNPVSVHLFGKSGVGSSFREIRCRFIFSGKNGELTPDFFQNDEPTLDFPQNDELTPDFPPGKNGELTPDFFPGFLPE